MPTATPSITQPCSSFSPPSRPKTGLGASLRWAIGATPTATLQLKLQALLTRARYLNLCSLKADNAVSILVRVVPLRCEFFNGSDHSIPVPYFFTPDQEASFTLMKANSDPAYHAIAALNARIRHNEHLNPEDALNYVRGKHRPSCSPQAFLHAAPPPPPRRHASTTASPAPLAK
jgi:hypothetical protein